MRQKARASTAAATRGAVGIDPVVLAGATMLAAAAIYFFRIGSAALGASEAYSAWAAAMPSVRAIVQIPVLQDPGKQVFYYAVLHYFASIFGFSEASLRGFSAISALASIAMLFMLGRAMFDEPAGAAAAILWAFNPVLVLFARRARMYPMFAAVALAHLLLLWQVRRRPNWPGTIACAVAGAAMVYTHLAGLALIGAEAAMLLRDAWLGRRDKAPWIAIAIALGLFAPYLPIFLVQSRTLVYGHWLDWMGAGYDYSVLDKTVVAVISAALGLAVVFGPAVEDDRDEPLRWCAAWGLLPLVAFVASSVIVRPMLHVRYLSPCLAMAALVIAGLLGRLSGRTRNLATAGIAAAMLVLVPFLRQTPDPWRDIAVRIASGGSAKEPVFFESGFVSSGAVLRIPNGGFPDGYYRIPFDYYFRGPNPRIAIPAYDPEASRSVIKNRVAESGGGWLVSWKDEPDARGELPDSGAFRVIEKLRQPEIALYRIESTAPAR